MAVIDDINILLADNTAGDISEKDLRDSFALVMSAINAPIIYDAYLLGSSVNADVTMSIYHKFDGLTEETRNDGIDLTDGQEYLIQPMYQSGLTDAHILDNVNMFTAKSFADQSHQTPHPDQLYGDSGNPILGSTVKAWVNAGDTIAIKYDTVFGALKVTIKV